MRLKSLSDIDIVGTRIDSDLFSCISQYLEYHLRDTPLPVGACDMDRLEGILWITKIRTCSSDIIERVLCYLFSMEEFFKDIIICWIHVAVE